MRERNRHTLLAAAIVAVLTLTVSATIVATLTSCGADRQQHAKTDSLNLLAYAHRYVALDSTAMYARLAYEASAGNAEGRAEALLNQAFVQYMLMDYDSARTLYTHSRQLTKNIITQAAADVGLMKICQITGRNDEFYNYRHEAETKLRRLSEQETQLTPLQFTFYNYARSEYHMTSATYYRNTRQTELARQEMDAIATDMQMVAYDYAQLARYHILNGDYEEGRELGMKYGMTYMVASASQRIADKMVKKDDPRYGDSIPPFALYIAHDALRLFSQYGSLYSRALTYLTIADFYAQSGMLEVALDTATKALEFVNIQHKLVYGEHIDFLTPFSSREDMEPAELAWLRDKNFSCAWEWIATIRQHLSMIFGQMGMKTAADYNSRIYWKILDDTRQDKRLEHQISELEAEKAEQTTLAWIVALLALALAAGSYLYIKHLRRITQKQYEQDIHNVETSFRKWMGQNEALYTSMQEREKQIDSETYVHEQHIAENKRSYIDKCTSLSLVYSITPFLDRAINELAKLRNTDETKEVKQDRMDYLSELIDRINLYNSVLSHWIKVRQGMVTLNVSNFRLSPLLDTLRKNHNSFTAKGLTLKVEDTHAVVKADKALTMFMMNTLLDNARKYTPKGGEVSICATEAEQYIEISVTDTGKGLSPQDIKTICQEKVYDSSQIGDVKHDPELRQSKGFGFGLMNCKGVIDKYKKTNQIFSVCTFGVESKEGKGSRFYFRLPKGVMRTLALVLLPMLTLAAPAAAQDINDTEMAVVSNLALSKQQQLEKEKEYEKLKKENAARQTFFIIATMLAVMGIIVFMVIYYRIHLLPIFNMRQLMQLNRNLFDGSEADPLTLVHQGINDIKPVDGIAIAVMQNEDGQLNLRMTPTCPFADTVETIARQSLETGREMTMKDGELRTFLLLTPGNPQTQDPIGVVAILFHNGSLAAHDEKIMRLIMDQLAQYIYYKDTKVETHRAEIELKEDEKLRAEKEENTIHIQNMVLDNCLSAIKHETMYYPNRIRQLLDEARHIDSLPDAEATERLNELITYYKEVFTLLSSCAARQLDNVMFRRKAIPVSDLTRYARKSMKRQARKHDADIDFHVREDETLSIVGDQQMLEYLMDNLIASTLHDTGEGTVSLAFDRYEDFARITLADLRTEKTEAELAQLFYPEHLHYDEDNDKLRGVEYLVCRQIVREHDEHGGRRGCRIIASKAEKGYKLEVILNGINQQT